MDGQDHERRLEISRLLVSPATAVEDRRLPAPDVLGHLADRLIYRSDLRLVAEYIQESWPNVTALRCSVYEDKPHFSIHIAPFSKTAQRDHWPLAEWIQMALNTSDCQFFYLPPIENPSHSTAITIYEAATRDVKTNG